MEFLEEIYNDLGGLLPPIYWEKQYYISFYDNATGTYHVKTMRHKSPAFEKFLEFISLENQSEKKLKRYQNNRMGEFNSKAFKS